MKKTVLTMVICIVFTGCANKAYGQDNVEHTKIPNPIDLTRCDKPSKGKKECEILSKHRNIRSCKISLMLWHSRCHWTDAKKTGILKCDYLHSDLKKKYLPSGLYYETYCSISKNYYKNRDKGKDIKSISNRVDDESWAWWGIVKVKGE